MFASQSIDGDVHRNTALAWRPQKRSRLAVLLSINQRLKSIGEARRAADEREKQRQHGPVRRAIKRFLDEGNIKPTGRRERGFRVQVIDEERDCGRSHESCCGAPVDATHVMQGC